LERKLKTQPAPQKISGTEAATLITSSSFESYETIGFDIAEAERVGFKLGEMVEVFPDDTGALLREFLVHSS
jgi:hypothetical protein